MFIFEIYKLLVFNLEIKRNVRKRNFFPYRNSVNLIQTLFLVDATTHVSVYYVSLVLYPLFVDLPI